MESCSNQSKYILYLRFFKVATLCFDDSFSHAWHSLNQLCEVVVKRLALNLTLTLTLILNLTLT